MTIQEFKKKYGTDTVGLMIDLLLFRIATKSTLNSYEQKQIAQLKSDLKELLS